jgi:hypothetical protein
MSFGLEKRIHWIEKLLPPIPPAYMPKFPMWIEQQHHGVVKGIDQKAKSWKKKLWYFPLPIIPIILQCAVRFTTRDSFS